MLLARRTKVVQKDRIHHNSDVYFADELWGMVGEEVEVAHMPHDRRWIEVFHKGQWLATARPSVELDAAARARAVERRREDARELKAWARRARRRASVRFAPITTRARSSSSTRPRLARTPPRASAERRCGCWASRISSTARSRTTGGGREGGGLRWP
ncbi:MAG: Mu transposase C-terminal domain-containing protein [Solirubrobacteraceae bacterium]